MVSGVGKKKKWRFAQLLATQPYNYSNNFIKIIITTVQEQTRGLHGCIIKSCSGTPRPSQSRGGRYARHETVERGG